MSKQTNRFYVRYGKRAFDVFFAVLALLLLAPLFVVLAFLVRIRLGKHVFFCQQRAGRDGVAFQLYKFRTMTDARDDAGRLLPDAERLGAFGCWLRSTSLDELPELWNVLRGDMSFVGPRPLLMDYLPLYSEEQFRRHEVLPGITGLAQVHGRNTTSWPERFKQDVSYVDSVSFFQDMRILFRTIATVLSRDGVSAEGHATMPPFAGS